MYNPLGHYIVPMPGRPRLTAVHLDGHRVDVHRTGGDLSAGAAGPLVMADRFGQGFPDRLQAGREVGDAADEPSVGGLTAQAFVQDLLARAIPNGHLHGRIVGQAVDVVLMGIAQGQGVQVVAKQFGVRVTAAAGIAGTDQPRGQVSRQPQAVIGLAEEDGPGVGGDAGIGLTDLDGLVKRGGEHTSMCFTHWAYLPFRRLMLILHRYLRDGTALRTGKHVKVGE
jgi:hypothetical protein